jgi:MFS family permease
LARQSGEARLASGEQGARAEWRRYWPLVSATAAGMALAGLLSAVLGIMLEPMQADLGWSRAEIFSGPMVVAVMGLFLAAPAGHLIDRWGSRRTGALVVVCTFLAILAMAMVGKELWQWWAAWSLFGIAGAFTSTVWMAPVSTLFDKGRGMAIAVTIAGASISGIIAPPMTEWLIQTYGWRSAFIGLAVVWCGLALPLVLAFVPGPLGEPDDQPGTPEAAQPAGGLSPREGLTSRAFWLIFAASLVSGLTGLALVLNLVPVLTYTGIARADAIWIASVMGMASLIGRLVSGWLMDTFDIRKLAIIGSLLSIALPLSLILAPGVVWITMVSIVFHALVGGLRMSAVIYMTSTYLGARSFGLFYGAITTTTTVAQGLGPLIANAIYDQTQSYAPAIWATIPGFALTALCFAALGPKPDFSRPAG